MQTCAFKRARLQPVKQHERKYLVHTVSTSGLHMQYSWWSVWSWNVFFEPERKTKPWGRLGVSQDRRISRTRTSTRPGSSTDVQTRMLRQHSIMGDYSASQRGSLISSAISSIITHHRVTLKTKIRGLRFSSISSHRVVQTVNIIKSSKTRRHEMISLYQKIVS